MPSSVKSCLLTAGVVNRLDAVVVRVGLGEEVAHEELADLAAERAVLVVGLRVVTVKRGEAAGSRLVGELSVGGESLQGRDGR